MEIAWRAVCLLLPFGVALDLGIDGQAARRRRAARRGPPAHRLHRASADCSFFATSPIALSVKRHAFVGEDLFQHLAAEACVLFAARLAQEAADFGACPSRDDELFPKRRRRLLFGAYDLDLVAVLERRVQRHMHAVDLGADRRVADVGVDGISEIDGRGAARQRDRDRPSA